MLAVCFLMCLMVPFGLHLTDNSNNIHSHLQVYPEGTHFMIPWFDRPVIYDVRARPNLVESTSGSRDLQMVQHVQCFELTSWILLQSLMYFEICCRSK